LSVFKNILLRRCPKCGKGKLFKGLLSMHQKCPHCDMIFEREQGYYTGAMFVNWFFAVFLITPLWVYMLFSGINFWLSVVLIAIILTLCVPMFFQFSRTLWLYFDYHYFHPE
jgi:uncharacterized protein (DUF983 family)